MSLQEWLANRPGRCPHGWHIPTQGCADCTPVAPTVLRDTAQAAASAAHPSERAAVDAAIRQLAATGRPFSANDARPLHNVSGPVVGAAFTAAARAGLIKRIGYEASTEPGTHAHPVATWRGVAA